MINKLDFKTIMENVKKTHPLIHNITNYVTVHDVANIVIACGGSPIMSDEEKEVEDITTICNGLNINIGTLNEKTIRSMLLAGKRANKLKHTVVLDPVGAGASKLRTDTAAQLLKEIHFDMIKGNISEIKSLMMLRSDTKGVDANISDAINENNLKDMIDSLKAFSQKIGAVIVVTGPTDIITNSSKTILVKNGVPMMSNITGSGCMLSAMSTAYIASNRDNILESTACAVSLMGIAGEIAFERMDKNDGNSSFSNYLIDAVYNLTDKVAESKANYQII